MNDPVYHVGEVVAGRFEVRAAAAPGRLGAVYRAHDREVEVDVALKVIEPTLFDDERARDAFVERMRGACALSHPNLARLYAAMVERGRAMLVMQFTPGVTLETLIGMRGAAPGGQAGYRWSEARPILSQIAAGLGHALSHRVVHGELRPSAVVVLPDGVKITSVGLAAALPRPGLLAALGRGGGVDRLAPELRDGAPCDERADVWGFARLAVEMMTARPPQEGFTIFEMRGAFELALDRALDVRPDQRFPTVEALMAELDRVVPGQTRTVRPSDPQLRAFVLRSAEPPGLRETTARIDEDELRRMAGEISELIDTTRTMDPALIEGLRVESSPFPLIEEGEETELDLEPGSPRRRDVEVTVPGRPSRGRTPPPVVDLHALPQAQVTWPGPAPPPRTSRNPPPGRDVSEGALTTPVPKISLDDALTGQVELDEPQTGQLPRAEPDLPDDDPATFRVELESVPQVPKRPNTGYYEAVKIEPASDDERRRSDPPPPSAPPPAAAAPPRLLTPAPFDAIQPRAPVAPPPRPEPPPPRRTQSSLPIVRPPPPPVPAPPAQRPQTKGSSGISDSWVLPSSLELPPVEPPPPPPKPIEPPPTDWPAPPPGARAPTPSLMMPAVPSRRPPRRSPWGTVIALAGAFALAVGLLVGGLYLYGRFAGPSGVFVFQPAPKPPAETPAPPEKGAPPPVKVVEAPPEKGAPPPVKVVEAPPEKAAPPSVKVVEAPPEKAAPPPVKVVEAPPVKAAPPPGPPVAAVGGPCGGGALVAGPKPFCIDAYESPGRGLAPRTGVSRDDAQAACAARGARLCTDKEWERACRGTNGSSYPYGTTYNATKCNTRESAIQPGGAFPACRSAAGAFDMSGNAAEWTAEGVKGGAAGEGDPAGRCSHKEHGDGKAAPTIGFRCCFDVK